jgi:hypothetical protein
MVVNRYRKVIKEQATQFKDELIDKVSDYISIFIESKIPQKSINEAVKNQKARIILNNLRESLAIDSALMSESVQDAVVDGKKQIDELSKKVQDLSKENALIKESYYKTKSALILESKTSGLSDMKKEYIKRVLGDKTPKFIEENFDYTLRLFNKKEQERINIIKEQAFNERKVKADAPVIRESTQPKQSQDSNPYISELQRYK